MLISIIVPVYNIEKEIRRCVESIINQTDSRWQLVLVDDGSTDDSGLICDDYSSRYNKVEVVHKDNGGLSDARNAGVKKAIGDYILFVDGDDTIAEWTIERIIEDTERYRPEVIMSNGMIRISDEESVMIPDTAMENGVVMSGIDVLHRTYEVSAGWSACGKVYNRAFWEENGFEFLVGRLAEDQQLIPKVILLAKTVTCIPAYYNYIIRQGSIVTAYKYKIKKDIILNSLDIMAFYEKNSSDEALNKELIKVLAHMIEHEVWGFWYLYSKDEKKEIVDLSKNLLPYFDKVKSRENVMIMWFVHMFGLRVTCFMLGVIKKSRIS